ncbi:TPA: tetratricopeptide repeat protein [Aeromonas veronii]
MVDKKLKIGEQSCRDGLNWIRHSKYPEALSAFEKSYKYGFKPAANHLGIMYLSGEGVEKDYTKALSYFIAAADIPNTNAAYNAARILESGDAGYTDAARSILFYEKALKWNDKEAAYNLGIMYLNEKLIQKDIKKGILYLEKASDLLHVRAPFTLAGIYLSINNDPETIEESVRLLKLSSQRGFEEADLKLGMMYKDNEILEEESERKAEQHFLNVLNGSKNETKLELALYLSKRSDINSFYKAREIVKLLIEDKYPPAICMFKYKNDTKSIDVMSDYGVIQCDDMEIKDLISELYLVVSLIKESHAFNHGNISHFTSWPAMESILSIENKKIV